MRGIIRLMKTMSVGSLLLLPTGGMVAQTLANTQNNEAFRMAVISDVHVMDPALLLQDGKAFESYITHDRKMLRESVAILRVFTERLIAEHPQVVLITGDLTKDGEMASHRFLIDSCLVKLQHAGIQPLVIPGNHDVNNPHAVSFKGDTTERVPTVSAGEFAALYADYGYGTALACDEHSLSYVFEPAGSNLRILAIDACKYEENDFEKSICRHDGRIKPQTMKFIAQQVADARREGKRIIGMIHHGVVSHWKYQNRVMKGYLVDDWKSVAARFAKMGLEVVFTGHSHAQDIACHKSGKATIYDVETGSAVTYPSPYRIVSITDQEMEISSKFIENIPHVLNGISFTEHAKEVLRNGVASYVESAFPASVPDSLKQTAARCAGEALIANCRGDEKLAENDRKEIEEIADALRKYSARCATIFRIATTVMRNDVFPTDNEFTLRFRLRIAE